jgi:hypothetical protein
MLLSKRFLFEIMYMWMQSPSLGAGQETEERHECLRLIVLDVTAKCKLYCDPQKRHASEFEDSRKLLEAFDFASRAYGYHTQ